MSVGNSPHVYKLGRFVRFNSSTWGGLPFYSLMLISNKMHDQIAGVINASELYCWGSSVIW